MKLRFRKRGKRQETEALWWKKRIEGNIGRWRKDLTRVEEVRRGKLELSRKERMRMGRAYGLTEKGTLSVKEFLKSKIHSGSTKIRRFLEKGSQFHQNIRAACFMSFFPLYHLLIYLF